MRFFYDREHDSLLITLAENRSYRDSAEVAPGVVVDFDGDGNAIAIDIENASSHTDLTTLVSDSLPVGSFTLTALQDAALSRR